MVISSVRLKAKINRLALWEGKEDYFYIVVAIKSAHKSLNVSLIILYVFSSSKSPWNKRKHTSHS